ncbi:MAG: hypothetical protein SOH69_06370 [Olsenella sp.]|jgi:hypothetical protein
MSRVADEMDDLFDEEEGESLDVLLMAEDADISGRVFARETLSGSFGHAEFERCTFR